MYFSSITIHVFFTQNFHRRKNTHSGKSHEHKNSIQVNYMHINGLSLKRGRIE